ncbi:rap guanine nucleotide exchange factor 3-like [Clupea harengus]|uniref:Rap guanine nucleotide exchange factor 3-like n=1 Tax=Clupea harengus TaxID=7950 RepID=A0A6P8EYR1_CLUHA|nr:rap guanine nucleotide exchange factor 3-like [Clupea harengus]
MPQDTSVVIRKHDCHFLRVGNLDFVSILKDVNANIVHVEENGIPALILQRSSSQVVTEDAPEYASCSNNFLVKLGTPAKILQFLLGSIKLNTTDDRMGKQLPEASHFFMDFCQFET